MTNEEAIEFANEWIKTIDENEKDSLTYEFLAYVIRALQHEPSGDAVNRQAVDTLVDELARAISDERCFMSRGRSTATIMQDILDLPSVSTEKTGHWILLDECSNSGYYCSECHKKVVKEGWSETVKKIKFCPNCGAKMGVEE